MTVHLVVYLRVKAELMAFELLSWINKGVSLFTLTFLTATVYSSAGLDVLSSCLGIFKQA